MLWLAVRLMVRENTRFRSSIVAGVIGLAVAVAGVPAVEAVEPADPLEGAVMEAPIIIETIDPSIDVTDPDLIAELERVHDEFEPGSSRSLAAPRASQRSAGAPATAEANAGSGITVDPVYAPGVPENEIEEIQEVIDAAAQEWDEALATNASGPVVIAVSWQNLGSPSLLGSAGPSALIRDGGLPTDSFYPVALANTLLGRDVTDEYPGVPDHEVEVTLNSTANWYIGTSGSPGAGQVDLMSVTLHEIGHGLGFIGSPFDDGGGPQFSNPAFVYDHAALYNGSPLLSQPNPNALLTSNNLDIGISSSLHTKLHAPSPWDQGSSFGHFDEAFHPSTTPGALMTPVIGQGQVERELDSLVLGVMARINWPMDVRALTPVISSASAESCESLTVNWHVDYGHTGLPPDGYRLEAWRDGVTNDATYYVPGGTGSATISGLAGGHDYIIKVVPYGPGGDGVADQATVMLDDGLGPPRPVTAAGDGLSQTISWAAPACGTVTGYQIERSTDSVNWTPVGTTASTSIETTVPEGVHQFRVRAMNGGAAGPYASTIPLGVSEGIVRPVSLDGQVSRLYEAVFLRPPDAGGFVYWRSIRASGATIIQVANEFVASDEFQLRYGNLTNEEFVELVYQNVLGREPEPEGKAHWVGALNAGASRGAVMAGFSESPEFVGLTGTAPPQTIAEAQIYRLYVAFFLRFPDQGGYDYWVGIRESGASLYAVAGEFAASNEFVQRYGSLSNADFVELVYHNVLGRDPDPDGGAYWPAQLDAGLPRGEMMALFAESNEFVIATGTIR